MSESTSDGEVVDPEQNLTPEQIYAAEDAAIAPQKRALEAALTSDIHDLIDISQDVTLRVAIATWAYSELIKLVPATVVQQFFTNSNANFISGTPISFLNSSSYSLFVESVEYFRRNPTLVLPTPPALDNPS